MRQALAALALIVLTAGTTSPAAASCDAALQFVSQVGKQVTDTVANASLSSAQRQETFRAIFRANADFATMGKVALGRYWNKLPESRWNEYFGLMEQLIVRVMFAQLNDFAGESYTIETTSCNPKGTQGREFLVDGPVIKAGGGQVTTVRWWVIQTRDGSMKVLDVSIAGISLTLQKREEFDHFITTHGRRVEALLDDLRTKVGS